MIFFSAFMKALDSNKIIIQKYAIKISLKNYFCLSI